MQTKKIVVCKIENNDDDDAAGQKKLRNGSMKIGDVSTSQDDESDGKISILSNIKQIDSGAIFYS